MADDLHAIPDVRVAVVNAGTEGQLVRACMKLVRKDPRWYATGPIERYRHQGQTILRQRMRLRIPDAER